MRLHPRLMVFMLLGACAPDEDSFLNEFVPHECTWFLTCHNDATISFSGWDTQAACVEGLGSKIVTDTAGCTYNSEAAGLCLDHLDETACTDDDLIALPLECSDVYTNCESWL